jgi:hypothetical protein
MPAGAFMFVVYLVVAYLLYLALRRFVVNSTSSHVALFGVLLVLTAVGIPLALTAAAAERLHHERQVQRDAVAARIAQAGGWPALQKDCDALVEKYSDTAFYWHRWDTNALPPSLAALKPWEIRFYSPKVLRELKDEPQVAVVRIKIFGMHSTGGHSTPYFGLEIWARDRFRAWRGKLLTEAKSRRCFRQSLRHLSEGERQDL